MCADVQAHCYINFINHARTLSPIGDKTFSFVIKENIYFHFNRSLILLSHLATQHPDAFNRTFSRLIN
ncbi:hypothetical protein EGR_10590 [Echinococcus granulosus]|uniref:Uncharacterized protein n=1 Tax=Echinococcus granulosus TaxID=6210 RepID=W6U0I6_ECHGR|nr:hypothetical protein EGR_10590 [Echinococcus granulosus]EUB54548.1 hypothetical protein EGR_10590 [Echinococcus granulosus]